MQWGLDGFGVALFRQEACAANLARTKGLAGPPRSARPIEIRGAISLGSVRAFDSV